MILRGIFIHASMLTGTKMYGLLEQPTRRRGSPPWGMGAPPAVPCFWGCGLAFQTGLN